nr:arylsulfatase [Nodosilinea sp. P-1105]
MVETLPLPEEGYNLTHDLADRAIAWINQAKTTAPDRPFFAYFAPGAVHAPHQPPAEYVAKYQGQFDQGWDKLREETFARQKKLGVIPANAELTPRPEQMPAWDSFSPEDQKILARQMETYAGFLDYTDYEIGRVVDAIADRGELDNTLVIYINGDNGASAEGSLIGSCNEVMNLNGLNLTMADNRRCYDSWGSPETSPHYAVSWAWAMDSPFRWTKQVASYLGGIRNGMVISWPANIKEKGGLRSQFGHVIDIAPTILEAAGIPEPDIYNGIAQKPMEGTSLVYTFERGAATTPERHTMQYFEMLGHRALYKDGMMASAFHNRLPWINAGTVPFDTDKWELFDLSHDFTQARDLSTAQPETLKELQDFFLVEAEKYNVFPLDDRFAERADVTLRPGFFTGRKHIEFAGNMPSIPEGSAPSTKNASHTIDVDLMVPPQGAEGVIVSEGGLTSGFSLYVKDNKLTYDYNWFDLERTSIAAATPLPTGKVHVRFDFAYDGGGPGKGGTGTLYVNNRKVGQGKIPKTVAGRFGVEAMDFGKDLQSPVSQSYQPPFAFTGVVEKVVLDIK